MQTSPAPEFAHETPDHPACRHGGPNSEKELSSVIEAADALASGALPDAQAVLICLTVLALLRELEQWRLRAAVARDALVPGNVFMFRAG